jgi:hypothetical protein
MKRFLLIVALLLAAVPARADTTVVIVDIIENPFWQPSGMALYFAAEAMNSADPYAVSFEPIGYSTSVYPGGWDVVSVTYVQPAVPEPATWAMLLIGFALLGSWQSSSWPWHRHHPGPQFGRPGLVGRL